VLRLAERWSEAARAQSIYPPGHHRVGASLEALAHALSAARALEGSAPLQIVFTGRGVLAQDTEVDLALAPSLGWLRERLEHAALAGVAIGPEATPAAFAAFDERLLALYGVREPVADAAVAWAGDGWGGLQPLDRRFEGVFGHEAARVPGSASSTTGATQRTWAGNANARTTDPRQERLVAGLLQDPALVARLRRLTQGEGAGGSTAMLPAGDDTVLSPREVLDRLVTLVAAEDQGAARANQVVAHLVEALETRTQGRLGPVELAAQLEDAELSRRAAWLSSVLVRKDLDHEQASRVRAAPAQGPKGHAGDDQVADDPAGFLEELAALPASGEGGELERPSETLGVLLHILTHHEEPARIPALLPLLAEHLKAPDRESVEVLARVLGALRAVHRFPLARQCGFLTSERMLEAFPLHFGDWLQSLQPTVPADRNELVRVLERLGPKVLQDHAAGLGAPDQICRPGLAASILRLPVPILAPLATIWLRSGDAEALGAVVGWLRSLRLKEHAAQLLELLQDSAAVPSELLNGLIGCVQGRTLPAPAREAALAATAEFVRASAGRADRRARRLEALRMLGGYASPEAAAVLSEVLHRRRWLVIPLEDRLTRRVAAETLRQLGAA
jgi:hypothetical protein